MGGRADDSEQVRVPLQRQAEDGAAGGGRVGCRGEDERVEVLGRVEVEEVDGPTGRGGDDDPVERIRRQAHNIALGRRRRKGERLPLLARLQVPHANLTLGTSNQPKVAARTDADRARNVGLAPRCGERMPADLAVLAGPRSSEVVLGALGADGRVNARLVGREDVDPVL